MIVRRRERRASALIISIAILSVLALLAISFARLMVVERDGSRNHAQSVQATMTAASGVEYAISWFSRPENITPSSSLGSPVEQPWIFRKDDDSDVGAGWFDIEEAQSPSFEMDDNSGHSLQISLPDPGPHRHYSRLKVMDTASQVNLNGPVWDDGGFGSPCSLRRLLQNLGRAIEYNFASTQPDWWPDGESVPNPLPDTVAANEVVDQIIALRQALLDGEDWPDGIDLPDEFASKDDVRDIVESNPALSDKQRMAVWKLVKDYLAVQGWKNERAVRARTLLDDLYSGSILSGWWNREPHKWGRKRSALNDVMPRLEARYPVNINTAPRPVLIAIFLDLLGVPTEMVAEQGLTASTLVANGKWLKRWQRKIAGALDGIGISNIDRIAALADEIITYRNSTDADKGPFDSVNEFMRFLQALKEPPFSFNWLDAEVQQLIWSNAFPDQVSGDFLGQQQQSLRVSKLAVSRHTTEICFGPMGYFEVQSLGWVEDVGTSAVVAQVLIESVVKVWDVSYLGSQRDFEQRKVSSSDTITGPEPPSNLASAATLAATDDSLLAKVYGNLRVAADGSPYEGWIIAHTETSVPEDSAGALLFRHDFSTGLSATSGFNTTPGGWGAQDVSGSAHDDYWKGTGISVYMGEAITPDGMLAANYSDETITFDATNDTANDTNYDTYEYDPNTGAYTVTPAQESGDENLNPYKGTIEFWLKLPAGYDSTRDESVAGPLGAHEAIFYANSYLGTFTVQPIEYIDADADGNWDTYTVDAWCTWKLERYGKKIRSTRFISLNPLPSEPVYFWGMNMGDLAHVWTEIAIPLDDMLEALDVGATVWGDGEWHHVIHTWVDYTQQALYVDGVRVACYRAHWMDADVQGSSSFGINTDVAPGTNFALVSAPLENKMWIGGLVFSKTTTQTGFGVFRGQSDSAGAGQKTVRMANCKIDDIRVYGFDMILDSSSNDPYGEYESRSEGLKSRLRVQPTSVPYHEFQVDAPVTGRLVAIAFNTLYPTSDLVRDYGVDPTLMTYSVTDGSTSLGTGGTFEEVASVQSGGTAIDVAKGDDLTYRIEFDVGSGANQSPVVESVTTYYVVEPTYFSYVQKTDR